MEPENKTDSSSPTVIEPVDFTPLSAASGGSRWVIKPLALLLAAVLFLSVLILWFLLTAKSLVIKVEPVDARVELDGLSFRIADYFLVRRGEYQVVASAPGYQQGMITIRVGDAESQVVNLVLEKLPGHVQVQTDPPGAEIYINGEVAGVTPVLLENIPVGEHQLLFKKQRFLTVKRSVTVAGMGKTQQLAVQLQPGWGSVVISSYPSGSAVRVGGELRGNTPLTTELLAEGETVELQLEGYKPWQQQLSVAVGETLQLEPVKLQPLDGLLKIRSQPEGASVTINGAYQGTTPLELQLPPGKVHKLRLFLDGFRQVEKSVTLTSGEETVIQQQLSGRLGTIRVAVQPEDAEILINGVPKGNSRQFKLPARIHRLEIRRPGYATQVRDVTPRVGLEQVLQIKLLTDEQARWANTPRTIQSPAGQQLKLFRPQVSFTMGASRREPGRRSNEIIREVSLERPFYLSLHTVTNKQYKQFDRKHTSSHFSGTTLDTPVQPAIKVSWLQAALYCNWLSEQQQLEPFYLEKNGEIVGVNQQSTGYRLPTEAEWAWAARYQSGGMLKFPWGNDFPPSSASGNYADKSGSKILGRVLTQYQDGHATSAPVGRFSVNSKGLFDMGSNVSEWLHDYYGVGAGPGLSVKKVIDPLGPEKGEYRVIRGASWRDSSITELRLSYRDYGLEGKDDIGFRVARYAN